MAGYEFFDIQFDDLSKGTNEWIQEFGEMTRGEFNAFFEYVFVERVTAMMEASDDKTRGQLLLRLPMMVALCSKMLEAAHFCNGEPDDWREATINIAQMYFDFLMSILGNTRQGQGAQTAWNAQREYSEKWGYKSSAVFAVSAPHKVFA